MAAAAEAATAAAEAGMAAAEAARRAQATAPCGPMDGGGRRYWVLGGLIFAQVHMTRDGRCVVFVVELLKTAQGSGHGCGAFGPAAMAQLRAAVRQRLGREVDEWQLLVRKYYSAVEAERAERTLVGDWAPSGSCRPRLI